MCITVQHHHRAQHRVDRIDAREDGVFIQQQHGTHDQCQPGYGNQVGSQFSAYLGDNTNGQHDAGQQFPGAGRYHIKGVDGVVRRQQNVGGE